MRVPACGLYGEGSSGRFPDALHVETIVARSSVHDWKIRPHRHQDLFQFLLIVRGGGIAIVEDVEHRLGSANVILLPPMAVHGFEFWPDTSGWVASIPAPTMRGAIGGDGTLRRGLSHPQLRAVDPAQTRALGGVMACALDEFAGRGVRREAALQHFAALIAVGFVRLLEHNDAAARPQSKALIARYLEQVEANFRTQQPLAAYAERLGIGVPHLTRLCRETLGSSALTVLHDRIMLEARRDLVYTAMTIVEISSALGFSDPAYFSRFFNARAGVRPTAFRARERDHT